MNTAEQAAKTAPAGFSYEVALKNALDYFNGEELPAQVWVNKYALRHADGSFLETSPADMHRRIVNEIMRIEDSFPQTDKTMDRHDLWDKVDRFSQIVPQGSPMAGIGNDHQILSLSNCFVIGHEQHVDSYGGIMMLDEEQVHLMKRRGGVGHDLSHIRPAESPVNNAARTSTGVISFMERYSNSTREVAQNGRRGALMLSIDIRHPDAEAFIDAKLDTTKVTGANVSVRITDEFMMAVQSGSTFTQQFPIDSLDPEIVKEIDAQALYNKIVKNAHASAEPGILFWDQIIGQSTPDQYEEFQTTSTNPCLTGDTMVSVADGRGYVSIQQLAEEGDDVPVYTLSDRGALVVRTMRNPRVTGRNQKVYTLTIENGHTIRATANHKFLLTSGEYKRMDELQPGDSLYIKERYVGTLVETGTEDESRWPGSYWKFKTSGRKTPIVEHHKIFDFYHGERPEGHHIHHLDHNSLNNRPGNLGTMEARAHIALHAEEMRGLNNPIYKIKSDPERFAGYSAKMSESTSGRRNGNAKQVPNETMQEVIEMWMGDLGYRPGKKEYQEFAKKVGLPQSLTQWRKGFFGVNSIADLLVKIGREMHIPYYEQDPRLQKTYQKAVAQGYEAYIKEGKVMVLRHDELTQEPFWVEWIRREQGFANLQNALKMSETRDRDKRLAAAQRRSEGHKQEVGPKQVGVYADLKNQLGRDPMMKEWEVACQEADLPFRIGKHSPHRSFKSLKKEAETIFNHKVVSVEFSGYEDVYNGTVDDFHNFFAGAFEEVNPETGERNYLSINQLNCGEIPLTPYDSCRLLALNLMGFVVNPFTEHAEFDWDGLRGAVHYAARTMDNIVELEIEKIDRILAKIDSDPEPDHVKERERQLWEKIRHKAVQGRRTGVGITAAGDTLAALGFRYGTEPATTIMEEIIQFMAREHMIASIDLAEERGAFPAFEINKDTQSKYVQRVYATLPSEYQNKYRSVGRRSIASLTIAPTGSVSVLTQTTSGLENMFMPFYTRRRKINPSDENARVDFTDDVGDSWQEYQMVEKTFRLYLNVRYGLTDEQIMNSSPDLLQTYFEESPYYKATSNDVDWVAKVKMQGAVQRWIDHSISVTVNLPNDIPVETVGEVYMTAWQEGCKGITVYRDGSRTGVLVTSTEKEEEETPYEHHAPKRPESLPAAVVRFHNGTEEWVAVVGLYEDQPYEIFTGPLSEGFASLRWVTQGNIVKVRLEDGSSRYDFNYTDQHGFKTIIEGLSRVFNPDYWNYAKLISGILRHGMPLPHVLDLVSDLNLGEQSLHNWKAGVVRALKQFIPDGTQASGKLCQNCSGNNLIYQEGCVTCKDCGSSKCG